ncbi:acyltransferase family protein [Actinophytocola xanthii]|uniref:acyltransferase family protein n=1 Tax=Actinophytocola xanthii TaxID=1912961 RepID=UPI000B14526B|nr:acyltransferase [Actinophytocola xanthii]
MKTLREGPATLPALTGYRFVLAFMVIACHGLYSSRLFEPGPTAEALAITAPLSIVAVSSFFILSGFILTWSAPAGDTVGRFYRRRFVKIFPNHVVTWALMLLVFAFVVTGPNPMYGFQDNQVSLGEALSNLFLVQNWLYDVQHVMGVNAPAWSISCEVFFYLLFPALFLLAKKIAPGRLWWWVGGVAALILLVPLPTFAIDGPMMAEWAPAPHAQVWLVYVFPPVRLLEFGLGILIARLVQTGQWPSLRVRWAAIPLVLTILASPVIPAGYLFAAAFALPAALVIPAIAQADLEDRRTWLRRPVVVLLGNASFALYLVHGPILYALRDLLGPERRFDDLTALGIVVGFILVSQVAALALYRYLEVPMMRRFARPRSTTASTPSPVPQQALTT